MSTTPNSPEARDVAYHLHAYTNAKKHEEVGPLLIDRGEGVYVYDNHGKRYLEAMSGLWSVGLGFSEKRLVEAATRQMERLPYYHTFTHKGHNPVADLAEKLVTMAPVPMSKAFFTNSGSEAIDTALKMIWYRSNALGKPEKKKIIVRNRAYHGVTIAAAALTSLPANHNSFDLIVPDVIRLTAPHFYREGKPGETEEQFATRLAEELDAAIQAAGPDTVAAMFAEPLQGAGGVIVPPATYWEKIQAVLAKYDILLVADEVICGFGRTGSMFGCETFNLKPDMMALSKQISSSYIPASALLINKRVYGPIRERSGEIGTFGHGFTAGGHPVASAVSLETIRIIEEDGLVERAGEVGAKLQAGLRSLADHPLVGEVRGMALIAAIELVTDKEAKTALPTPGQLGAMVNANLQEAGIISRAMVDALAFCPPLIITEAQVEELVAGVRAALDKTYKELGA
ncbi:aspartate aminotransferase family protein [Aquamicrobium zhengzhouense]|uniref:Aspartate aminotransferase family protein n=1 Tax=Aquamicrobium zhengzhouense TaxID=2781738 RepID=A0ABS0SEL1_9HYPH|nr:aspartate aminotransferase family protein [Aquamicrobium zhengzhouense]MBI1621720.1 aspartate aminotransferase family protein [Aquamicrobium zhengzhouense]